MAAAAVARSAPIATSWEDLEEDDLASLLASAEAMAKAALAARSKGEASCAIGGALQELRLRDGTERFVRPEWFHSVRGTPLHVMLFDSRFAAAGALDDTPETFDDIVAFLRWGSRVVKGLGV